VRRLKTGLNCTFLRRIYIDIFFAAYLHSVVSRFAALQAWRRRVAGLEVGSIYRTIVDISPISIYRYRYRIGTLYIGFSIYRYRIGDKRNIGNFVIFYYTFSDFLMLI